MSVSRRVVAVFVAAAVPAALLLVADPAFAAPSGADGAAAAPPSVGTDGPGLQLDIEDETFCNGFVGEIFEEMRAQVADELGRVNYTFYCQIRDELTSNGETAPSEADLIESIQRIGEVMKTNAVAKAHLCRADRIAEAQAIYTEYNAANSTVWTDLDRCCEDLISWYTMMEKELAKEDFGATFTAFFTGVDAKIVQALTSDERMNKFWTIRRNGGLGKSFDRTVEFYNNYMSYEAPGPFADDEHRDMAYTCEWNPVSCEESVARLLDTEALKEVYLRYLPHREEVEEIDEELAAEDSDATVSGGQPQQGGDDGNPTTAPSPSDEASSLEDPASGEEAGAAAAAATQQDEPGSDE